MMINKDQKDALQNAFMKMLDQFPGSAEGDDIQEDSAVESMDEEGEDEMEEEDEEEMPSKKKGGALVIAFGKMRGK